MIFQPFLDIKRSLIQLPGWHTNKKLVVFESDDWGCWRTRDKHSISKIAREFPHILDDPYSRFDTLETSEDLHALFDVLRSVKDKHGQHAVLTANTIMANPDFEKIKAHNYESFFYKPYLEEIKDDEQRKNLRTTIDQGVEEKLYFPQLHGRDHVNAPQWLTALKNGHMELNKAFDYGMFGVQLKEKINKRNNVMAALDANNTTDLVEQSNWIKEGQSLFLNTFGFASKSFIAPSYIWHSAVEPILKQEGIQFLQGISYQYIPNPGGDWYKTKYRFTGRYTKQGLTDLVRNVFFEPSLLKNKSNIVDECMHRIKLSFTLKKPAIVGVHRLNFMGGIEETNRNDNLKLFKNLLSKIVAKWPDVEFISSNILMKHYGNE